MRASFAFVLDLAFFFLNCFVCLASQSVRLGLGDLENELCVFFLVQLGLHLSKDTKGYREAAFCQLVFLQHISHRLLTARNAVTLKFGLIYNHSGCNTPKNDGRRNDKVGFIYNSGSKCKKIKFDLEFSLRRPNLFGNLVQGNH